jgi:hypothetical protein
MQFNALSKTLQSCVLAVLVFFMPVTGQVSVGCVLHRVRTLIFFEIHDVILMRLTGRYPAMERMEIASLDLIFRNLHSYTKTSVIACMPRRVEFYLPPCQHTYSMHVFRHTSLPAAWDLGVGGASIFIFLWPQRHKL